MDYCSEAQNQEKKTLTALQAAEMAGGELLGDPELLIDGVDALDAAGPGKVSFLGNSKYRQQVLPSRASVVLVPTDFKEPPPENRAWIVCDNPSQSFSRLVEYFAPAPPTPEAGVDDRAVVAADVKIPESASIGPFAVLEEGVEIGENTIIGAGCYVGYGVKVGEDSRLHPNVSVREYCRLGNRVVIHCGTVIGSDGFGYIPGREGHSKIPQRGVVCIDDDVEIGALVAVDRARFGCTWIKQGVKIDNLVQIAHNVVIGEHSFIVAQSGIAGSARLQRHVAVAGQAGIAGHLTIGEGATILGQAGVGRDVPPATRVWGSPAMDEKEFLRGHLHLPQLPSMKKELRQLRREVADLRKTLEENQCSMRFHK